MINKTVVLIKSVNDPYEPDDTIDVCSTMDEALKLNLEGGLWDTGKETTLPPNSPENDAPWERSRFTYTNLKTGKVKITHEDLNRPSPYAQVVPMNVIL